ncbi:MAG: DUF423 domain-containing protein [Candidatus Hydrogenedentes bacterium]|nr:DUF423 domain-containing protein [Candidatus Hydrogenedentota bacterium]
MTQSRFLRIAAVLGGLAVALGAFAAHGLKGRLDPEMLTVFETGVRYQMYHALAMLALAAGGQSLWSTRHASRACCAWGTGIVLFSGSLYLLAVTGTRWLGAITPFGGVAFLVGWVFLAMAAGSAPGRDGR